MSDIKIVVTQDKFSEILGIDEYMNLDEVSHKRLYEIMLNFVVDESGQYVDTETARGLFRNVKLKEFPEYIAAFYKAISDAFVNPTSGGS